MSNEYLPEPGTAISYAQLRKKTCKGCLVELVFYSEQASWSKKHYAPRQWYVAKRRIDEGNKFALIHSGEHHVWVYFDDDGFVCRAETWGANRADPVLPLLGEMVPEWSPRYRDLKPTAES